jgi:hypothetical protein
MNIEENVTFASEYLDLFFSVQKESNLKLLQHNNFKFCF